MASTSRQVGTSVGVALCGALTGAGLWWLIAVLTACIAIIGVAANTPWAKRSSERVAPLLEQKVPAHAG